PSYEISKFVYKILSPYVLSFEFNMKDSFQFFERIKSVLVDDGYLLISLDVVSLFTNVKQDLITNIIKERWNVIKDFINLDQELLFDLVKFCFHSGYFLFQRNYYIQKEGCGIRSPASPVVAITAVDYVISKALERLDFEIPVVAAYVDDLFLIIPKDKVDTVVNVFNSINKDIQFTIEVEQDGKTPYLDVLMERTGSGELRTSWYLKPYSSGRVLNFKSNHPLSQKLGVAQGFFNRTIRLSHATMVAVSIDKVRHLLINNNYPSSLFRV
ncbi:GSCOCG00012477001-RA-CDS, partial [Cotesia congregata]